MSAIEQTERPTGLVAFLFTDVVGSTRLWAADPDAMATDLEVHDREMRAAIDEASGYVFFGAGDSFGATFHSVAEAVAAAVDAQRRLDRQRWQSADGIAVRMGIHLGEAIERGGDYFGPPVNLCARLMSVAAGRQILLSSFAIEASRGIETLDLGTIRLRDIEQPVGVAQVVAHGLAIDLPAPQGVDARLSTLPHFRSSFVGRRTEIERIRRLLADNRIVTITGVGGVGKTRTAVEAGAQEALRFEGSFFIDLAAVGSADEVASGFASGIELATSGDPVDGLITYLSDRDVLLVVDNCEHLLDPTAELVEQLLTSCPGLTVLATSREALDVDGEETIRLPSLGAEDAALRLFVERATAVNDRFELTPQNRSAIVELCERLDGMPLAIELAASRSQSQSPTELLAGLDDRFSLLRAGRRRGVLQRQRTLEATIEWSYHLLDADEQRFFRSLGAFSGPFLFHLVPGVTDVGRADALDLLDSLVAKSLVTTSSFEDGSTSYRLLETLRSFAIDRLADAGETGATALRHRDAVASELGAEGFIVGAQGLIRFRHQIAEVFAAFDRAIADTEPTLAARIICGANIVLTGSSAITGLYERVTLLEREWLEALDVEWKARVFGEAASVRMLTGDYLNSIRTVEEGLRATAESSVVSRHQLHLNRLIFTGSVRPREALEVLRDLESTYEREQVDSAIRQTLRSASCGIYALNREYDALRHTLERLDLGPGHHMAEAWRGWFEHLTGERVPFVAPCEHVPERGWEFSARIGRCMGSDATLDEKAMTLVEIADTFRHGRLPFEDSEYLTAFARLALLRGDHERAKALGTAIINRASWSGWANAYTFATLERWPDDEWVDRYESFNAARFTPTFMMAAISQAPILLDEEIDRWRR